MDSERLTARVRKCLRSWLHFDFSKSDLLSRHDILNFTLQVLSKSSVVETAKLLKKTLKVAFFLREKESHGEKRDGKGWNQQNTKKIIEHHEEERKEKKSRKKNSPASKEKLRENKETLNSGSRKNFVKNLLKKLKLLCTSETNAWLCVWVSEWVR